MLEDPTLPQWLLWTSGAIGTMAAAFVLRMGWKSAGGQKTAPSHGAAFVLDAALVDSASIKLLTASVEALTLEGTTTRVSAEKAAQAAAADAKEARAAAYRVVESCNSVAKQLESVNETILRLTMEMIRRPGV